MKQIQLKAEGLKLKAIQKTAVSCKPQAVSKYKTKLKTTLEIATITPFVIEPREVNSYLLHKKYNKECLRAD